MKCVVVCGGSVAVAVCECVCVCVSECVVVCIVYGLLVLADWFVNRA